MSKYNVCWLFYIRLGFFRMNCCTNLGYDIMNIFTFKLTNSNIVSRHNEIPLNLFFVQFLIGNKLFKMCRLFRHCICLVSWLSTQHVSPTLGQYFGLHWIQAKTIHQSNCWINVGPASTTLAQHWSNNGWMSDVHWAVINQLISCWRRGVF